MHTEDGGEKHTEDGGEKHTEDGGEKHMEDGGEKHMEDGGEKHTEDGGEKHTEDGGEKHMEDGGEKHTEDGGEKHTEDGGKKHTEDGGKKHTEDGGKKHTEDGGKKMKNKVQLGQRSHTHIYIYINISAVSQTSHQSYHVCLQGENLKSNGSCKGGREKLKQAGSKHRAPKRQQRQNYSLQDTKHLHTRAYNKAVHYNQPSMTHLPYNASTRTLTWGKTDRRFGTCIHLKQSTRWKCWSSSNH